MTPHPTPLPIQWNQLLLCAIKLTKTSPPLAARALAMVHTAMYDAWSVYDEKAISTSTACYIKIKEKDDKCAKISKRKAYSYAAYRVLTDLFWLALPAENKQMFSEFMCELGYDVDDHSLDITKPQGIGNLVARLIIENHDGDESNSHSTLHDPAWSDFTGYKPVNTFDRINDLSFWQPLKIETSPGEFKIQNFLTPHWGLVKPFALNYNWQFRPNAPYKKDEPGFRDQAEEIRYISEHLSDREKVISEYWSDGPGSVTPPGHWCEIVKFVAERDCLNNRQCIKLLFAISNAMLDASIAAWECKHYYDSVRPVTAIREIYRGVEIVAWGGPKQGTRRMPGESWMPYQPLNFVTPPFAEHVSGHSTFSRAAATILSRFLGSDNFGGCTVIEKGCSSIEPGLTPACDIKLEWKTFTEAAIEAGMSRLYGGIHFKRGNESGQELGVKIGECVWQKARMLFNE